MELWAVNVDGCWFGDWYNIDAYVGATPSFAEAMDGMLESPKGNGRLQSLPYMCYDNFEYLQ